MILFNVRTAAVNGVNGIGHIDTLLKTCAAKGSGRKCHEEVLYMQPMIPPKRFDIFSPLTGGYSEGLDAF